MTANASYETFSFPRCLPPDEEEPGENGLYIGFTKTAFRPYDIAVTVALLIAKRTLGDQFLVHTDGLDAQWSDAKHICQEALGYGDWFGVVEEPVEEQWPGEAGTRTAVARTLIEMRPPVLA